MFWIFAAVALVLAVINPGFRKLTFWVSGITGMLILIIVVTTLHSESKPAVVTTTSFDPDAYLSCTTAQEDKDPRTAFFACH